MRIDHQEITVAGVPLHYRHAGAGAPLVLVHGAGDTSFDWHWVMPMLAQTYNVYAPDMPGYGGYPVSPTTMSTAFFTRCIGELLDTLQLAPVVLIGHSLGGLFALQYTLDNPTRVAALVLVDSGGLGREIHVSLRLSCMPGYGDMSAVWGQTVPGALHRVWSRIPILFAQTQRVPPPWILEQYQWAQRPGVLSATVNSLRSVLDIGGQRICLLDQLPRLTMPVLFVWGKNDQIIPVSHAYAAVEQLPHGQLAILPNCGHIPQVECPEQFEAAVGNFLADSVSGTQKQRVRGGEDLE